MEENVTIMTVLQELREFRSENNKRWEENDRRWEENDKRWEENNKRWEENDKRWAHNEKRWIQNEKILELMDSRLDLADSRLDSIEKVVSNLEEERKRDRKEILDVLDTMQKSIDKQFCATGNPKLIRFNRSKLNGISDHITP